jgi:hypothetical protein
LPIERGGSAESDFEPAISGVAPSPAEQYYKK